MGGDRTGQLVPPTLRGTPRPVRGPDQGLPESQIRKVMTLVSQGIPSPQSGPGSRHRVYEGSSHTLSLSVPLSVSLVASVCLSLCPHYPLPTSPKPLLLSHGSQGLYLA